MLVWFTCRNTICETKGTVIGDLQQAGQCFTVFHINLKKVYVHFDINIYFTFAARIWSVKDMVKKVLHRCCAIKCCAVQSSAMLCWDVLCHAVLCCAVKCCAVNCWAINCWVVMCCDVTPYLIHIISLIYDKGSNSWHCHSTLIVIMW